MAKPDFANVEFRSHGTGSIHAWIDGKFLGVVHTEGNGVFVRVNERSLRDAGRSGRSNAAGFDGGVKETQGGACDS